MSRLAGLGLFAPVPFVGGGADFDGVNDWMTRGAGLTGAADSKLLTFAAWVRADAVGTNRRIFSATNTLGGGVGAERCAVNHDTASTFKVVGYNAAGSVILNVGTGGYGSAGVWLGLIGSFDLADTAKRHLYVNDISDLSVVTTYTNDTMDFTLADWAIGAVPDGTAKWDGCLAEIWVAPGQYIDLSVADNRRKFIDGRGKPANLGPDGSWPTGTAPLIYHRIRPGETVSNFATNNGTGGNFSITGALSSASDSPSD